MKNDTDYLALALVSAQKGRGFCAPNPAVGAVLVKRGVVIATGYHQGCGLPHAEVEVLQSIDVPANDMVLYVTLEPCCHMGRTPPCTDLIIKKGVGRVVYAFGDPNPQVAGQGAAQLKTAGIVCEHLPQPAITAFYQSYAHWFATGQPFVTAKIAVSLDGKIAGVNGQPIQITGKALGDHTHQRRYACDALLTTSRTVIADNPQFNVRLPQGCYQKPIYVIDPSLKTPLSSRIFNTKQVVMLYSDLADRQRLVAFDKALVRCVKIESIDYVDYLRQAITQIGADGFHDLWVESGATCFQTLLRAGLLQRALIYVGARFLGHDAMGIAASVFPDGLDIARGASMQWHIYDQDMMCEMNWSRK